MNKNNKEEIVTFSQDDTEEDHPQHKDYVFHLRSGEKKISNGFLAVAAGFVAVGTSSGDLQLVVPLDNLHYAEELPAIQGQA